MKSKSLESPLSIHIGAFFSHHLAVERGASPHTIRSYANALTGYLEYLETVRGIRVSKVDTSALSRGNVLDYLNWLENDKGSRYRLETSALPPYTLYVVFYNMMTLPI